jgi:hypothetical protein
MTYVSISISKKTHAEFEKSRAKLSAEKGKVQTKDDSCRYSCRNPFEKVLDQLRSLPIPTRPRARHAQKSAQPALNKKQIETFMS